MFLKCIVLTDITLSTYLISLGLLLLFSHCALRMEFWRSYAFIKFLVTFKLLLALFLSESYRDFTGILRSLTEEILFPVNVLMTGREIVSCVLCPCMKLLFLFLNDKTSVAKIGTDVEVFPCQPYGTWKS